MGSLRHNMINPFTSRGRPGIQPGLPKAKVIYWDYRRQRQSNWTTDGGTGILGIPIRHQGRTSFPPAIRPPIRNHKTEASRHLDTHRISGEPAVHEGAEPSPEEEVFHLGYIIALVVGGWMASLRRADLPE